MRFPVKSVVTINKSFKAQSDYLLCIFFCFTPIIRRVTSFISLFLGIKEYVEMLNIVVISIVVLISLRLLINRLSIKDILRYLAMIGLYFLCTVVYTDNYLIGEGAFAFLVLTFPAIFLGRMIEVDEKTFDRLLVVSNIAIFLNTIIYFTIYKGNTTYSEENMGFAYVMLPLVLFSTYSMLKHRTLMRILCGIAGALLVIMQGSRGPIFILVLFYVWFFVSQSSLSSKMIISVLGAFGVILFYFTDIFYTFIKLLSNLFQKMHVNTRIFELLLAKNISDSNGRDYIQNKIIEGIQAKPYGGYGPFGDVYLLRGDTYFQDGIYAHNLILEFICHYGIIIGIFLLALIFLTVVQAYRKVEAGAPKVFLVILVLLTVVKFFFSSSYLQETAFYLLLGYCINMLRGKK